LASSARCGILPTSRRGEGGGETATAGPRQSQRRSRGSGRARLAALVAALAVAVGLAFASGQDGRTHGPNSGAGSPARHNAPPPRDANPYGAALAPAARRVHARFNKPPAGALLFDLRTGSVLWERHPTTPRPIASVTKMMTALLVVEREPPTATARITRAALHYQGSGVGLLPRGKRVSVTPLLYGLLLPSGNDAARVLAQNVGGTIPRFVRLMNERARQLGLTCTHFVGPDGYSDGNRSCPRDLARLAAAVMREPRLRKIVSTSYAVFRFPIKGRKLYLAGHNPLDLRRYRGWTGIKTGYTPGAGECFVGTARRGSVALGVVLLRSPDAGRQAVKLLDRGFAAIRRPLGAHLG
jgi:serine-type D-Ala-D-Ala carboxypeptidase (penicillin-binding protein 5/6)